MNDELINLPKGIQENLIPESVNPPPIEFGPIEVPFEALVKLNDISVIEPESISEPTPVKVVDTFIEELNFHKPWVPFKTLAEVERIYTIMVLNYFKNDKTKASKALGITVRTLYNRLHQYGEFEKYRK